MYGYIRHNDWGDNSVSSCRSYSRAKSPGATSSAGAFPMALSLSGEHPRGPRRDPPAGPLAWVSSPEARVRICVLKQCLDFFLSCWVRSAKHFKNIDIILWIKIADLGWNTHGVTRECPGWYASARPEFESSLNVDTKEYAISHSTTTLFKRTCRQVCKFILKKLSA